VYTGLNVGYVLTRYLTDVKDYDAAAAAGAEAEAAEPTPAPDTSGNTPDNFTDNFVAYAIKKVVARTDMSDDSPAAFSIPQYDEVTVSANQGGWSYIRYKNSYGYVPTEKLFRWDRIDPYAGDIPGCTVHIGLAFVNHTTDIRSYEDNGNEVLKTVNPGSALAVDTLDSQGRYPLAYWRTTGYVDEDDVGYLMKVVPWDEAESGDLISCMSTYYAVGIHTLQYQGRNYNIYRAPASFPARCAAGRKSVNTYALRARYSYSTGFHARVMNPHSCGGTAAAPAR
jgi:uncharacterized protein YgiM (DUF1202 family)